MILVTGAAGKTGAAVIHSLALRGEVVAAFVRSEGQAAQATAVGAGQTIFGDLCDARLVAQAARGVRALYHICPNMHPDEVAIGSHVIAAARAAGVERLVYHSVLHPQTQEMPHHWNKLAVEEMIFACGLPFTILQPTAYMQNILASWRAIVEQGVYRVPYPPATRLSLVDLADVAEVAAKVLVEDGHEGAIYELVGSAALSQLDVAAALSQRLERPVRVEEIPLDAWERSARSAGMTDYAVTTLLQMFRYYARHGLAGNPNVLGWLLGRAPTSLGVFLGRQALE
jgi:uncharacterized protein YbjT (DUF2867 family)